jgi:hypothetical protein
LVNSGPLDALYLQGQVILLRFFTDNHGSTAGLCGLLQTYQDQGLTGVSMYAPSPMPTQTDLEHVRRLADHQPLLGQSSRRIGCGGHFFD